MNTPRLHKLSTKIVGALVGFLCLGMAAIGATLYLSWQLEGSAAAINEAGSLRMQTYRLTLLAARLQAQGADARVRQQALRYVADVDTTLERLRRGDPQRPLFLPPDARLLTDFQAVLGEWSGAVRPLAVEMFNGAATDAARYDGFHRRAEGFVAHVNSLVLAIEFDSEQRTQWLRASQLAMLAMAMAGTVSLIYLMFILIIEPVRRLGLGMARVKEKDFSVRVDVESNDEFGQLARGFNDMAGRLETLYGNLEQRVQEKTQALEQQNMELALLYDISAFLQTPLPLEDLCRGFMDRINTYFAADGSSVRVLDPARGNLHMVVHTGISEALTDAEHCMKVGDCLCGDAVAKQVAVVHDLRQVPRSEQLMCRKEGFATVAVYHIYAHKQHIGFFNLHFRSARAFSTNEDSLLNTLGRQLGVAIENLRLAARAREMAISEERNLVAQGLHDSIAQSLNFLNLQVQMLESSLAQGRQDEVAALVPALKAGVKESYEDVRELLLNFRSRLNEDSLDTALRATIERFQQQTGIAVELDLQSDGAPFPREQQLQLLFIVQEALSNVRKHALASRVRIRIEDGPDFRLRIEDNGVGFDTANPAGATHVGLSIMGERAQRMGAELDVQSAVGQGTVVSLLLQHAQRRVA
ncbi:type IV pili methyl-accepting chemotaxis transducer N-terminal domain-containing protein [Massilia sp. TS11]|uniref:type IV pili methyl-accepting chemotaxis transducer N-terminal domain-containing protein n=1 Tax=Massilia sp. TS11 TaxID=2908003 RepID=UPI001EDA93E9|nr:type IV pili methyl-accepting chemotaxis transducer N-terminal domain-containing protein [Massilia sp. TS11]MCG2585950.1 type IV pili methyl-accepting chemotaxis transducer N-terminal domain-containing protein [Massilia sp. TS11]